MKTSQNMKRYVAKQRGVIGSRLYAPIKQLPASKYKRFIQLLLFTNAVSVFFFLLRLFGAENFRYWFMLWNLLLAWIAPLIAWWLVVRLQQSQWRQWFNIVLTFLWIGFLPNSFYMVSDLIHVHVTGEVSIIFDAVLFSSFIFNGFIAGYIGTYLVHRELLKRLSVKKSYVVITVLFAVCGYAIYLGRVLRWNSWDALFQPAALIFDISDDILNPLSHLQAFEITFSFMLLIGSFYLLAFELLRTLRGATR